MRVQILIGEIAKVRCSYSTIHKFFNRDETILLQHLVSILQKGDARVKQKINGIDFIVELN